MEPPMSANGLPVFDKTLQTTNIWLNEIAEVLGPDRHHAWKVLSTVLQKLRDRLPVNAAAHLGAQLPLLVRGAYYDQYVPARQPSDWHLDRFVEEVAGGLQGARPTDPHEAVQAVLAILSRHIPAGEIKHVKDALPKEMKAFWHEAEEAIVPPMDVR
jgi:uncharacterized protein (DUF2267 family)